MFEIEFKFPVKNHADCRQQAMTLGATSVSVSQHVDEYFNHRLLDFAAQDIALRIRSRDDRHILTWKGPTHDSNAKIREEIEITLNADDRERFRKMLFGMGFHSVATVCKQRESLSVESEGATMTICLDTIEGLGTFVELEIVAGSESAIADAERSLDRLAKQLKIQAEPTTVSYLEMLLRK